MLGILLFDSAQLALTWVLFLSPRRDDDTEAHRGLGNDKVKVGVRVCLDPKHTPVLPASFIHSKFNGLLPSDDVFIDVLLPSTSPPGSISLARAETVLFRLDPST